MAVINAIAAVLKAIVNVSLTPITFAPGAIQETPDRRKDLHDNFERLLTSFTSQGIVAIFSAIISCLTCGKAGRRRNTSVV
jgi:hypothetical protein